MSKVYVIDVESGNLQSLENALAKLGYQVELIKTGDEFTAKMDKIDKLLLPGVGNFGHFMNNVHARSLAGPIKQYIATGKPLMGICVGLQALLAGSTESPDSKGLEYLSPLKLSKFSEEDKSVPHIGWNGTVVHLSNGEKKGLYGIDQTKKFYFVHSYAALLESIDDEKIKSQHPELAGWDVAVSKYGNEHFIAALAKGNMLLTQFHPEKSGEQGLAIINSFLQGSKYTEIPAGASSSEPTLTKRVIACLDVRTNDEGDLVVTKGDQYDVRERKVGVNGEPVRNLGKPVEIAQKYYEQGADEVTFLNITSFRSCPLKDLPMLQVLKEASKTVFVPLTIGGGIRDTVDPETGKTFSALEVATMYFLSGADKVSIGSDAVYAAEKYYANGNKGDGTSPMETISKAYGVQAVVVSVDPKRVYVNSPKDTKHHTIETKFPGPNGEKYVWYQCTVKGGREARDLGAYELVRAVEALGAGEILLNCIDKDGTNSGFDLELVQDVKDAVSIPVIASSGAGKPEHFVQVFQKTTTDAALGAGMFHRNEYTVGQVKQALNESGLEARL
ncbi:imidazole glycerol phosphate synthase hisHF [Trichomonascus vanleenenianus]|uniref:imidazoleglycerol-phosphate synthase n=1 Tax=Trichomonascus vanleenenianus TaxID=2268995 RepID=UPI003ECB3867